MIIEIIPIQNNNNNIEPITSIHNYLHRKIVGAISGWMVCQKLRKKYGDPRRAYL